MEVKDILKKEPFKRPTPILIPKGLGQLVRISDKIEASLPDVTYRVVTQDTFLSELHPSGHAIHLRADKQVKDAAGNITQYQSVAKVAVPLQEIIATKQKIHLSKNPTKFTLTEANITPDIETLFVELKQAWLDKNMHVGFSEFVNSWLKTGDAAMYMYRSNGELKWRTFSFLNGDVLLPHYNSFGEMVLFGRYYSTMDSKGNIIEMLDTFDSKNVTTYSYGKEGILSAKKWRMMGTPQRHGFSRIPIVYKRSDDVCWGLVQNLIDNLEESISNMSENNRYYANLILFITGDVQTMPNRDDAGKILAGEAGADAKFLATPSSNEAQMNEIDFLFKQILAGSFTVQLSPDTLKSSGDLPGITVKLFFSSALEKAYDSAKSLDSSVDDMVKLFKEGYGLEVKKFLEFKSLKVRGEVSVFVPENDAELARVLNESVFAKTISIETANEQHPNAVNGEKERVKQQSALEAASLDMNN